MYAGWPRVNTRSAVLASPKLCRRWLYFRPDPLLGVYKALSISDIGTLLVFYIFQGNASTNERHVTQWERETAT